MPSTRLGRHARRWISVGVIVVVAGSGGATAWAMTGPSGPDYRTAAVTRADVTQSLISTGTIEPVSEANVSFPVSGQVSSVSVGLGSHVTAGQVLARLSTSALASDVSSAESAVATANERLAADEASETTTTAYLTTTASVTTTAYVTVDPGGGTGSGGSGGTGGSGGSGGTGGSGSGGSGGSGTGGSGGSGGSGGKSPIAGELREIASEQRAVVAAQHRLDGQLAEAKSLLTVEGSLCTATTAPTPPPGGTPTRTPTGVPTGTPTGTATGTASPTPTPTPAVSQSSPSPTPTPTVTPSQSATQSSSAAASDSATRSATVAPTTAATAMAYLSTQPTSAPGGGPSPTTCQAAIDDLMSVQTTIASTEQSLANSEADLDHLLGEVYTALEKTAGSGSGSGGTGSGGTGSGGSGGTGTGGTGTGGTGSSGGRTGSSGGTGGFEGGSGGSTSSGPATAAQLASDQAGLDSANAELSEAKQNLAAAVLAAPISGTVALVNVTSGQQVTGSEGTSASADFVIEGAGGEEATTTVSVSDVGEIRIGQPATITLDGSATPINGRVDSIGMLSSTSSSGSASYPVTIGLAAGTPTLFAGSDAQVAITLANVSDAVTVPTSAVEGIGAASFVTVLQGGKPETVRVTVGATGPVDTQITSGLSVGEQVVLADLSTPLPTNTNPFASRSLTGAGGGGFGGARTGVGATGGRAVGG
jgi:trimeric autotransporter adhesin